MNLLEADENRKNPQRKVGASSDREGAHSPLRDAPLREQRVNQGTSDGA